MHLNHIRRGAGLPLLLIHGLGSSWRTWRPILDQLAAERLVIAVNLDSGVAAGFDEHVEAVANFIEEQQLVGIDVVGTSLGAAIALELAKRGMVGACVALSPLGFWRTSERVGFQKEMEAFSDLLKRANSLLPSLTCSHFGRRLTFAKLSQKPATLSAALVLDELRSLVGADLGLGKMPPSVELAQQGPKFGFGPILIGWGRQDRLCPISQAEMAQVLYPMAKLHVFDHAGHYCHWDSPDETGRIVLRHARSFDMQGPTVHDYRVRDLTATR